MLKKYHVGEFIKNYMEVLELTDTSLSRLSGISRNHIINIKKGTADLNVDTSIAIAQYLEVPSSFLIGLQIEYKQYLDLKAIDKKVNIDALSDIFKDLFQPNKISMNGFEHFNSNPVKYCEDLNIVHYQPSKAKDEKNFMLMQSLKGFEELDVKYENELLNNYLKDEYVATLSNVNSSVEAKAALAKISSHLKSIGINIKIMKTNLRTTIKGISRKTSNQVNILIEDNNDFADIVWYMTHELVHLTFNKKHSEEEVNKRTGKLLIGEYGKILTELNEEYFANNNFDKVNKYFVYKQYLYTKNITNKNYDIGNKKLMLKIEN